MTKEAKMQIVVDNYFKSECDVNTSIRKAFEKGFRIGVQKGSVDAEPVKHGHWELSPFDGNWMCSNCGNKPYHDNMKNMNYCPNCGAKMDLPYFNYPRWNGKSMMEVKKFFEEVEEDD